MTSAVIAERTSQVLSRELATLKGRVDSLEMGFRGTQLSDSSIQNGYLSIYDDTGVERARVGLQEDGTYVGGSSRNNSIPPPVPATPQLFSVFSGIKVVSGGTYSGAMWTRDFSHINVYAAPVGGGPGELVGSLAPDPSVFVIAPLTYGVTYRVWLTSVNTSGAESAPSAEATASPTQVVGQDILDGIVSQTALADGAVTAAKIAAGAVGTVQLGNQAVSLAKLADGSVGAAKLIDGAVVYGKIAADAVGTDQLIANSVIAGKIAASAVTTETIAAGAVQAINIAAEAIAAGKIAAGAITAREIAALSITGDKIAANTITAGNILAGSITAAKLEADMVLATRIICGNPTGARSELHPIAGIQLYGPTGTRTTHFNAADGTALVTGEFRTAEANARIRLNPGGSKPASMWLYPDGTSNYGSFGVETTGGQALLVARGNSTRSDQKAGEFGAWPTEGYVRWVSPGSADPHAFLRSTQFESAMLGPVCRFVVNRRFPDDGVGYRFSFLQNDSSGNQIGNSLMNLVVGGSNQPWLVGAAWNAGMYFGANSMYMTNGAGNFGPVAASSFVVSSSIEVKDDVTDFELPADVDDLLDTVVPKQWVYRTDKLPRANRPGGTVLKRNYLTNQAGDPVIDERNGEQVFTEYTEPLEWAAPPPAVPVHFGWIAEDLESAGLGGMVRVDEFGNKIVNIDDKIGLLAKIVHRHSQKGRARLQALGAREITAVEARAATPALVANTPVELDVAWPGAPLAQAPTAVTVCQELPGALIGKLTTSVVAANHNGARVSITASQAVAAGAAQVHVVGHRWGAP